MLRILHRYLLRADPVALMEIAALETWWAMPSPIRAGWSEIREWWLCAL